MARLDWVDSRLQRWAQWVRDGDGSGYPMRSTLDQDWSPPSAGSVPAIKVCPPSDAKRTDVAVRGLSVRLADTLVMHYIWRMAPTEHAVLGQCELRTVQLRIELAHRKLARVFDAEK